MKKIVLFASGTGTNAENIIRHFKKNGKAAVIAVFCNNPKAKIVEKLKRHDIRAELFTKEELSAEDVLQKLQQLQPDLIVLAGFLLKFPQHIIEAYPNKIINIHPALLPNYGGKGMYGIHVHQAIFENKEKETGISIHYVDEHYDNGDMIFQKAVSIQDCLSAVEISEKVHQLEQDYFPTVIEKVLENQNHGHSDERLKLIIPGE